MPCSAERVVCKMGVSSVTDRARAPEKREATQMVHGFREQMASQRFEDLGEKIVQVARAASSCRQPQQSVRSPDVIRAVV
ncbi:hypothetical protein KIN20_032396 [Parelaphostrongylus tenuis]|uniref:Uncharacterized protein n=1 Tax=Parelaphostrongylus tenuis TaxID=148309 RepID=A0AAD5WI02_PARTN|nr:hypothetical protein KIN20_032396 [Parelaphostrongylus tenuis]